MSRMPASASVAILSTRSECSITVPTMVQIELLYASLYFGWEPGILIGVPFACRRVSLTASVASDITSPPKTLSPPIPRSAVHLGDRNKGKRDLVQFLFREPLISAGTHDWPSSNRSG